jgi:hypothetical protein
MVAAFNRWLLRPLAVHSRARNQFARPAHEDALIVGCDFVTGAQESERTVELRRLFG